MVYVTHDQSEALTMSDQIAVFNDGIIQQLASPADLYERPENSFIAQFIGENNQLMGVVEKVDKNIALVALKGNKKVSALMVDVKDIGEKTLLSIRPERVIIKPRANHSTDIDGKVLELIYLGDHIRCRMMVAGNDEFIVKMPNSSNHTQLKVGEEVGISWQKKDCRALKP